MLSLENIKIDFLKSEYEKFKETDSYKDRKKQLEFVLFAEKLIIEVFSQSDIKQEDINSLIQILKNRCSDENFEKYINLTIIDGIKKHEFINKFKTFDIKYRGFTDVGKNKIQKTLNNQELKEIQKMVVSISNSNNILEIKKYIEEFSSKNIPEVKEGIYSPWLYYIKPNYCPIINDSIKPFIKNLNYRFYSDAIDIFNYLSRELNEDNLGFIDSFIYGIKKEDIESFYYLDKNNFDLDKFIIDFIEFSNKQEAGKATIDVKNFNQLYKNKKYQNLEVNFSFGQGRSLENTWINFLGYSQKTQKGIYPAITYSKKNNELVLHYGVSKTYQTEKHWSDNKDSKILKIFQVDKIMDHSISIKEDLDKMIEEYNSEFTEDGNSEKNEIEVKKEEDVMKNNQPLNTILYGPPGTGKTYNTINKAIEIIDPSFDLTQSREIIKSTFDSLVEEGRIVFTTFHQSMSYEDFVEGIKPKVLEGDNSSITYEIESGIFKRIASYNPLPFTTSEIIDKYEVLSVSKDVLTLKKPNGNYLPFTFSILYKLLEYLDYKEIDLDSFDGKIKLEDNESKLYPELEPYIINGYPNIIPKILKKLKENKINREKPFVLIIDEINRGNVSQIFGELITLIEEDKRLGNKESLEVTLPYSKEKFGVPSNLYIIGTMNTADRSVEALDTALRRRFTFEEMPPRYDLPELEIEIEGIKISDLLKIINSRIEKLLDKDHLIGHSFFINVKTLEDLQNTFYKNIIPLLQEYFFGDYGKIGLILGKGFVSKKSNTNDKIFASFEYDEVDSLKEKVIYQIIDHRNDDSIDKFKEAIKTLVE